MKDVVGRRVVITGGAGFIGSRLARTLAENNDVVVIDDFSSGKRERLDGTHCEILHTGLDDWGLGEVFKGAEVVFHLAAQVSVQRSIEDPLYDAEKNVMGTIRVLEHARRHRVPRVVFSSSAAVYGSSPDAPPHKESHAILPMSPYGQSKAVGERYVSLYGQLHKVNGISLRFFNVYGEGQDPSSPYSGVMSVFMDRVRKGEPIIVNGSGQQTRDFVSVHDIVRACISAAVSDKRGVCNVGTGVGTSVRQLAEMASGGRVPIEHAPAREGEVQHSLADTTLCRLMLGFEARENIDDWIRACHKRAER